MNIYIYLPAHPAHGSQFLKVLRPDDPRTTYFADRKAYVPQTRQKETTSQRHTLQPMPRFTELLPE